MKKRIPIDQAGVHLTEQLLERKQLLVGGFAAYCMNHGVKPGDQRIPAMFDVYMSGAEHLWSSILVLLDEDNEPTDEDVRRMDVIANEIDEWRTKKMNWIAETMKTKGQA
jgi:hypothetical protein